MAWTYGFFDSINNDRLYNADMMSSIFEGLISDGVYESVGNKLAVTPNSGMVIQIGTGRGWFDKRWVNNDSPYLITLEDADVILNRYAAICIRVDTNEDVRTAEPYVKYSEFATTPVKPSMTRTEKVKEYCLAYVYIGAKATNITASVITDTRGNNSLCGWVTGLIEQLSTTTLFEQWEAVFNNWFIGLQDLINQNVEATLVNALPTSVKVTLTVSGWVQGTDGKYTQSVQVTSMNATKSVIVQPEAESDSAYSAAEVRCTAQGANTLTFTAVSKPTADIIVSVLHMGV